MEKFTDIKTFADACKVEKLDPKKVIAGFKCFTAKDKKPLLAIAKLFIIARATNRLANGGKEWKPVWNGEPPYKYSNWFDMRGSSGFRVDGCDYWASVSDVGSRLCFISSEVATHVGEQFQDLYKEFMVIE